MNNIAPMARPVPALGLAQTEAGDAYVGSLRIEFVADDGETLALDGHDFEDLMGVIGLRHLAFDARTRALKDGQVKAANLLARIDRNWSSIDMLGAIVSSIAGDVQALAKGAETISWRQTNAVSAAGTPVEAQIKARNIRV